MRDAAIECLEEVYKVYGEHLIDIINGHALRPATLNAIYARLAQMGADVAPVGFSSTAFADQSPTGKHSPPRRHQQQQQQQQLHQQEYNASERDEYEEHDTACSAQSTAAHNAGEADYDDYERYCMDDDDEEEQELEDADIRPPSPQQVARGGHPYSSNAVRQQLPAVAPEDSSASAPWEAGRSTSMPTAGTSKVKRGGYKVLRCTCTGPVEGRPAPPADLHPAMAGGSSITADNLFTHICMFGHRLVVCLYHVL